MTKSNFKWFRAYTLVEVIIVMVISVIVITMAGTAFIKIQKLYTLSLKNNRKNDELAILYSILKYDIARSETLLYKYNEIHTYNKNNKNVTYVINDNKIIRDQKEQVDTFIFESIDVYINYIDNNKYLIDTLKLKIILNNEVYKWHLVKSYGTAFYFNKKLN